MVVNSNETHYSRMQTACRRVVGLSIGTSVRGEGTTRSEEKLRRVLSESDFPEVNCDWNFSATI